ncbi:MAG: metallophosphoesterase family protein [Anaerolineae bacterium]|jgi:predicted phosphodiesterase
MTRLAVLSDIHGNLPALEAVLADMDRQGSPDGIWVLGDLVAFCPWPAETLDRLRGLPNVVLLQGNTDRYVVTGRRPPVSVDSSDSWSRLPDLLAMRDANFRWTVERLSYAEYEFLRDLPTWLEWEVPNYGKVVGVHANPSDDETNFFPATPEEMIRPHLTDLDARLLLYGHTHRPVDRSVAGIRLVNNGSVGLPLDGRPRPAYGLLNFKDDRCDVTIRRVKYDVEEVIAELERVDHPAREWVAHLLQRAAPVSA